ncbi:MAG: sigma-70 family RNA polymerase sigma factor [Saprospiraceae bacterium]|nr:sigma-70 family RNA polymerase sigma factor [Saprospiraceae bacterium]
MDWIERIKSDPDKTLTILYKDLKNDAIQWIKKEFGLHSEDADEIFQTSIVLLYDNVVCGKLTLMTSHIKTYIFSIIKNKIIQLNRAKNRITSYDATEMMLGVIDEEYQEIAQEDLLKANAALFKLGEPCKSLLELSYYQQMKLDDITLLLGYKNNDTTKNLKYKCMKRLQKIFFE